jgi:hypothetical protein
MSTDDGFLRANLYFCSDVIRSRRHSGEPIPAWMRQHHARLETAFRMSQLRQETGSAADDPAQSKWIGAADAGELLGICARTVHRNYKKWGGEKVSGTVVLDRSIIVELAQRKRRHVDV